MRAQRRGELFPLAHQAGQLLYGLVALERDGAYTVAVGIEARVAKRAPDLLDPALETVDPALDLRDARFQRPHLGGRRSSHDPRAGLRRRTGPRARRGPRPRGRSTPGTSRTRNG